MRIMMKRTMKIMKMKTAEEVDIETREEAREIMEAEEAVPEVQEDMIVMKITTMKIMIGKIIMIMMTKMMIEAVEEEAAVVVQAVVPAEDLVP